MKRRGALLLTAAMLLLSFTLYGASSDAAPEEAERFGTIKWYSSFTAESSIKDSFYYSDDWFLEDPEVQNDALALVSMQLTAAAVEDDENGLGTAFLNSLGFEETGLSGFDQADPEGCNFTWGTKTIGTGEDAFTLAAIVIQSLSFDQTAKQIGWRQNFLVNGDTKTAEHISYAKAADHAAAQIAQLDLNGPVKFWITGQSRGGAIAGVLAVRLKQDANSVYAYTFESPANVERSAISENASDYGYIHNYLCSDDVVTMIPPWDMTRYGTIHRLNTDETTKSLPEMLQRIGSDAADAAQEYDPDKTETLSTGLIGALMNRIPSREEYSSLHTDQFTDVSGKEIRISYRYQDLLTGLMQIVFGNVFEGVDIGKVTDDLPKILPAVSSLYHAVKEDVEGEYYEAAEGVASFLEEAGIELPLTTEDLYVLLKLLGPVLVDKDFVPEGDEFTQDEMIGCLAPVFELFSSKDSLIFSHQFDTIIARLKILAKEPEMENLQIVLSEPTEGEEVSSFVSQAEAAFRDPDRSWMSVTAEGKTKDETFLKDKVYYLCAELSVVGHSIPDDLAVTVSGKEPEEPLAVTYAEGTSSITGTWKYVLGNPAQVQVSFDAEGYGITPETVSLEAGTALKYGLTLSPQEIISDETGTYAFGGWYDENGIFWEDLCAEEDLTLHAKWNRLIDSIEIGFDIPHEGEEATIPLAPENAPYQIADIELLNEDWDLVTVIEDPGEYTMDFSVYPVSEEQPFLLSLDEEGDEIYAGVVTINEEEAEAWYEPEENRLTISYSFTALPGTEEALSELPAEHQIPTVYLTIDPDEFAKVNESEDHSYRAQTGSVMIRVPEDYTGDYGTEILEDTPELELEYIRGRGHGTWSADKKPYRIKLKEKADLLGMGTNKHWVLLANRYDPSLLRNRLISYIGTELGLSFTPKCLPVDLVVNGEYYGSYLLSEQVRVGKNRIDIDELTEEDITEPELTGGYLLYLNPLWDEPLENVFLTDRMVRFGVDSPQFTEGEAGQEEQKSYIADYIQKTENAIFSPDFGEEAGTPYSDYMDVTAAAKYWWVQEFSDNYDGMKTSSTYLYKERSGKLYWGPLWDFDLALGGGNDNIDGFSNCPMIWLDHLRAFEPGYQKALQEAWQELDLILDRVLEPGGVLDLFAAQIHSSWEADYDRWNRNSEYDITPYEFDGTVEDLRAWMLARQDWIRGNIDQELFHVYDTVTLSADGQVIGTVPVPCGRWLEPIPLGPVKEGFTFIGWEREDHSLYETGDAIEGDTVLSAVYIPEEEALQVQNIFFNSYDVWLSIHQKQNNCVYTLVPEDAVERTIFWTSSDPEVAAVDEYGNLLFRKTGETVITGTLRSGVSNSFTLHIYDSLLTPEQEPQAIDAATPFLTLKPGEYAQVMAELTPKPNGSALVYTSDDESVAVVDYNGVVWAAGPGQTTVHMEAAGAEAVPAAEVIVTVEE